MNPLLRPWLTPEWALSPIDKLVMWLEFVLIVLISVVIVGWQELRRRG